MDILQQLHRVKWRDDLPPDFYKERDNILEWLRLTQRADRIRLMFTPSELSAIKDVPYSRYVEAFSILRNLSPERAMLELALESDVTTEGLDLRLRRTLGLPVKPLPTNPRWDELTGTISYSGETLKTLRKKAINQRKILGAFEYREWRSPIDTPITGENRGRRTADAVSDLNQGLTQIQFSSRDSGKFISWAPL